jgi:hypothetical protein
MYRIGVYHKLYPNGYKFYTPNMNSQRSRSMHYFHNNVCYRFFNQFIVESGEYYSLNLHHPSTRNKKKRQPPSSQSRKIGFASQSSFVRRDYCIGKTRKGHVDTLTDHRYEHELFCLALGNPTGGLSVLLLAWKVCKHTFSIFVQS